MRPILLILLGFLPMAVYGQPNTISGYVKDSTSGEVLIGANIFDVRSLQGTASNQYGFFSLTLQEDTVLLRVSFVGYQPYEELLVLDDDKQLDIELVPSNVLAEVEVKGDRGEKIEQSTRMSTISVPVKQIKSIPAFLGEVDVMKAMQLLPGVQSGNEGSSGLYVRGGSPDQNLILLDGVPVYNVSHLFGFFSVFNADAINNVDLVKGGFPARYGGRLSSVLDISMKEGNQKEFKGTGSIGLVASRLTLEGPIVKDKASFMISGRRTYIDLLARPLISAASNGVNAGYYFYDLNAKVNYRISDKDRIYLSSYLGKDDFYFSDTYSGTNPDGTFEESYGGGIDWGNVTSVLRWNHQYNPRLFSNLTLNFTRYQFNTGVEISSEEQTGGQTTREEFLLRYFSGIRDWSVALTYDYLPNPDHYIKFGGSAVYHTFKPGAVQVKLEGSNTPGIDTTLDESFTDAGEFRLFVEDDWKVNDLLKINLGVHASAFNVREEWFWSVEPRISARYLLGESMSVKASYAMMSQYIHLLTNSGIGLPTDLWVPATPNVVPQRSWQVAGGLARSLDDGFEVSVEGYYKKMNNIIEYREGASYLSGQSWETQVTSGDGWSYGAELFVQKRTGKTTGWLGYTLSWTNRQFDDLNFGDPFPFKYDRRHDVSFTISHQFNERWQLSGTWVYGTGNAISLPVAKYKSDNSYQPGSGYGAPIYYYEERNGFRMKAYHRMDIGASYSWKTNWGELGLNFSIYNFYNRKNPFFIYEGIDESGDRAFRQVSLFPVIPSVALNFSF